MATDTAVRVPVEAQAQPRARRFRPEWLTGLAVVPVIWHLLALGRIFAARLTYPSDIEWMEGGQLYHAHRLLHGQPVYGPPEQGFVPYGYGPLHSGLLAVVGAVTEVDYWSGRLISIACLVLAGAVLYCEVQRHGGGSVTARVVGLLAVGSVAAGFPATGGWYDLIRSDTLAIALPIAAAALVSDGARLGERRRWVTPALLLVASIFAKQTDILFVAWIGLFVLVTDRRVGVRVGLLVGTVAGGLLLVLQLATHGWFLTWFGLMAKHDVETERLASARHVVFDFAPYLLLIPPLVLVLVLRGWMSRRGALWLGMLVCAFPAALLPYLKMGGYLNNLVPIVFLAGPVSLILATDLINGLARSPARPAPVRARVVLLAAASLFLLGQRYAVAPYIPTSQQREDADQLNAFVRSLDGGVLTLDNPFLAVRNGQSESQVHAMANLDAVRAEVPEAEIERFIAASDARWVLTNWTEGAIVERSDWFADEPGVAPVVVSTLTGREVAPAVLYRRLDRRDRRTVFDLESSRLADWEQAGSAFATGPIAVGDAPSTILNARGDRLVSSLDDRTGDRATGQLTSPPFVLDGTHVGLLVGGGSGAGTRVELVVDGRPIAHASGDDSDTLRYVAWDVAGRRGQTAQVRLVDESSGEWGHILVDQIETFSAG